MVDLVISSSASFLTSPISVTSSHEISDHSLLVANLSTKRQKPPRRSYQYRNIKDIDLVSFQQKILASSLFTDPDPSVDGFEQRMENTITSILNDFAPLKTGHRSGPRQTKNWLSPEAVEAKKCRRIGSSGVGRLRMLNQIALLTGPHAAQLKRADHELT